MRQAYRAGKTVIAPSKFAPRKRKFPFEKDSNTHLKESSFPRHSLFWRVSSWELLIDKFILTMLKAGSLRKCYMSVYFRQIWIFIHNRVLLRLYRYNGNNCTTKLILTKFRVYSEATFNTAVRWVLLSVWNQRIIKSWKYNNTCSW